jgi:hypothetical protein
MPLTRDQILARRDLPTLEVPVPEWGETLHVARLTAGERDRLEYAIEESRRRRSDIRAVVAAHCLCDDRRTILFTPADVPALAALDGVILDRVYTAALRFNRMLRSDIEELEGNSAASPSAASSSASQ